MPCFHPLPAWRSDGGAIVLTKPPPDSYQLHLPCGKCLGCRMAKARAWALRCQLELQEHHSAVFATLTYNDENLPPTLQKRDTQLWLKRLRKARPKSAPALRYFYSGEYGEQNGRPHYHAILYGLTEADHELINDKWGKGHTTLAPITPQRIAYCAGYTYPKAYEKFRDPYDEAPKLDPTGTYFYRTVKPFIDMSRRPGIGSAARQYLTSWRNYAIDKNGIKMPVPRYLHEAWKAQATNIEKEELEYEKYKLSLTRTNSEYHTRAQEAMNKAQAAQQAQRRRA